MARDKRVGFRGRHLIRQVLRNRNQNVRRSAFNELTAHLSRRHGRKMPVVPLAHRAPGEHRRLTRKARHLLHNLRQARTWTVTKRLLSELHREIEQRARRHKAARAVRNGARRVTGTARATGRAAARAGRWTRRAAVRGQERLLTRAERRQDDREKGKRHPGRIRTWRARRIQRLSNRTPRPSRSPQPAPSRGRLAPGQIRPAPAMTAPRVRSALDPDGRLGRSPRMRTPRAPGTGDQGPLDYPQLLRIRARQRARART